ncbi:hypothetical protein Rhe02_53320 [Rhizocola hellebori]|uniref:DUF58 domain-containing protein n=1 Tax=Rhizocola hellebori TaxID=1392758 RepID=A0A8J3QCQ7_9ACTN|nr:DUF58 domain-containing protein [Rhizocola hellebori]GIH07265.1 hypothetical protein Rhe02_53320 [Rhizocola hellebori]
MTGGPPGRSAVLNRLQLLVSRRLDGLLQGDYLGLLPGPGSEAGESREYVTGDDVRRMDWPVTARTAVPHVRLTVADRELETWLAIDMSASQSFGTAAMLKRDLAVAAAAAMTHLTVRGGNRVGAVIACGTGGLLRRPARGGRLAAQGLIRTIANTTAAPGACLPQLIEALSRPPRRRGVAVVISDFLEPPQGWQRQLRKVAVRHDVLAIELLDPRELELPDVGVLDLIDPETGAVHSVQTSDRALRERYAQAAAQQRADVEAALRAAGARHLRLRTDSDWLTDVVKFVVSQRFRRGR